MDKPKITEVTSKVVDLLEPFDSSERQRIVSASLTLLGDSVLMPKKDSKGDADDSAGELNGLSSQARMWMKQNSLSDDILQQVFHLADGKAAVIAAEIPGKDGKAKTINAYILQGLSNYLVSGDSKFDDKAARDLCTKSGCYNRPNHVVYLRGIGNKLTGSRDTGWTLTTPGLKYGAEIVKELTK